MDDEPMLLVTFARLLRTHFDVVTAEDGRAALQVLERESVDVLVSDYSMPGMSGVELMEIVALRYPRVIRILSTAHASLESVVAAHQRGLVAEVVAKPWTRGVMLAAIERASAADGNDTR